MAIFSWFSSNLWPLLFGVLCTSAQGALPLVFVSPRALSCVLVSSAHHFSCSISSTSMVSTSKWTWGCLPNGSLNPQPLSWAPDPYFKPFIKQNPYLYLIFNQPKPKLIIYPPKFTLPPSFSNLVHCTSIHLRNQAKNVTISISLWIHLVNKSY